MSKAALSAVAQASFFMSVSGFLVAMAIVVKLVLLLFVVNEVIAFVFVLWYYCGYGPS